MRRMLPALPYYPSHPNAVGLVIIGLVVGAVSGMLGIGGGVLVIPLLVFFFGRAFPHERAVGTSLAMLLPPIGIFAAAQYYRAGLVDVRSAVWLALAFAAGAWGGSWIVSHQLLSTKLLRVTFAFFLIYVAGNMLFRSDRQVWAVVRSGILVILFGATYWLTRLVGIRWERAIDPRGEYLKRVQAPVAPDYEI
jgi:uncharacterized membrane protein YfcA